MKFKVLLAGFEGSKQILAASSYLIDKYMPGFDVYFLNYGEYEGTLKTGTYVSLDNEQRGGNKCWALYMRKYLEGLDDKYIIFGLDDYFLNAPIDMKLYDSIDMDVFDSVNLCAEAVDNGPEYSCTTQYTIWDRKLLIKILKHVSTAWQFEDFGSILLNSLSKRLLKSPVLTYNPHSALSGRWKGVNLKGSEHDEKEIRELL